jgi:hypothetical protein
LGSIHLSGVIHFIGSGFAYVHAGGDMSRPLVSGSDQSRFIH